MKIFIKSVFTKKVLILSCCFFFLLCFYSNSIKKVDEENWYANEAYNFKDYQDAQLMADKPYLDSLISKLDNKTAIKNSYEKYYYYLDQAEYYFSKQDYANYNLNMAKQLLIQAFHMRAAALDKYGLDYSTIPEYELEKELSDELDLHYNDFSFRRSELIMLIEDYTGLLNRASYYYDNYQNGVIPLTKSAADSCSLTVQIMNKLIPFLCFFMVSLVCIPMIDQERKEGILKTMICKKWGRSKYILTSFIKHFLQSMVIVVFPIILCFLLYGSQDGFMYLNSKFPIYEDGLYSFEQIDNYYDEIEFEYGYLREEYFGIVQIFPGYVGNSHPQKEIVLINYGSALLLLLSSLSVIILFYVSLNLLLHVLFDAGLVAFIINSGLGILLISLSPLRSCDSIFNQFNPFTFRNPVWNLTGLGGFSFLHATTILLLYAILCYFLSTIIFKKKDLW